MAEDKTVVWTISGAKVEAGKENPKGDQPIVTFHGTIVRSDSKEKTPQKGTEFAWTPNLKAKGYSLDTSEVAKGIVRITGTIGKGGRKGPKTSEGDEAVALLESLGI